MTPPDIKKSKGKRRSPDPGNTRTVVLEAVLDTVYEHGFAQTTLAKILKKAKIKQGTLQHHFPTKDDLYREAVRYAMFKQFSALQTASLDGSAESRMQRYHLLEELFDGKYYKIIMEFWYAARTDPQLLETIAPLHQMGVAMLEQSKDQLTSDDERLESAVIFHVLRSLALDRAIGLEAHSDKQLRDLLKSWCK